MNKKAKICDILPAEIACGAVLQGNEYGWQISAFADAIQKAETLGYACLGGQFQFRVSGGTCEMYWLNADATDQLAGEPWADYSHRSCAEVLQGFNRLVGNTDFKAEASKWPLLSVKIAEGFEPLSAVVFVAYFVAESERSALRKST